MDKRLFEECDAECLRDEPAACTACCPLHVDIASLTAEIQKGDYKSAYKILEKKQPMAGIFGMICDHPCENSCIRNVPIRISELERAAVMYGRQSQKKLLALPKKNGSVAVIGGGVSGLSVALGLNKKGYQVTIYEKSEMLGGRIWDFEGRSISHELIEDELQVIDRLGIMVHYGRKIRKDGLDALTSEYDAVFLGTGVWDEYLAIDPNTFQVSFSSLFVGGRLLGSDSIIESVSSGKRAAVSMERNIQKISVTASRDREGAFETPMRYNAEGVAPTAVTELTGVFYTKEEAVREADRCFRCRCDECVKACGHLRKFNIAPKSYARQILINDGVIMGTRYANTMINSCAMCGLCGEKCPKGINMRDIIREARERMVETEKMPPSAHDFALRDMEFSSGDNFFMVKNPPAAGYMFYPGCQLSASCPENVEHAYYYLMSHISEGVGLMLGCCGAPADWAGRRDLALEIVGRIRRAWEEASKPVFILACTSCMAVINRYLPEIQYVSLWEIMNEYGLPAPAIGRSGGHTLHIHDACGARHNAKVQDSVRQIVMDMGYEIKELRYARDRSKCCGYGGLVFYANRDQANVFADDIINESREDLLVYCAMCKDLFTARGKRTYHILDLVFAEDTEAYAMKRMPGMSERRENRANLKRKLLRELWNEDSDTVPTSGSKLRIPQAVLDTMEKRLILLEDIEDVLEYARLSGQRFFNPEDMTYLACLRKKNVTYWVQWAEKEDGAHIVSAYSHRMTINTY